MFQRDELEALKANAESAIQAGYPVMRINASDFIRIVDMALAQPLRLPRKTRNIYTTHQVAERLGVRYDYALKLMAGLEPIGKEGKANLWSENQIADIAKAVSPRAKITSDRT